MAGLNGPIITHCSAGVGRTGTFLAVHVCMEKMKYYNSLEHVNIPRTVLLLRQSRTGMVQTPEQYHFIYQVLQDVREELREKAPRVFAPSAASASPRASLASSSSETDVYAERTRVQMCGLKRNFKEMVLQQQHSPAQSCSSESIMVDEERRKEKEAFRSSLEKKRRLSFSTC